MFWGCRGLYAQRESFGVLPVRIIVYLLTRRNLVVCYTGLLIGTDGDLSSHVDDYRTVMVQVCVCVCVKSTNKEIDKRNVLLAMCSLVFVLNSISVRGLHVGTTGFHFVVFVEDRDEMKRKRIKKNNIPKKRRERNVFETIRSVLVISFCCSFFVCRRVDI